MKNKILIFTSARSDYSILRNLIVKFDNKLKKNFKLIVIGNHFEKEFGYTYSEVISDRIKNKLPIKLNYNKKKKPNTNILISQIIKSLENKINPKVNAAILLGDRFETFAAAIYCLNKNIPIIHIGGGSVTAGSLDEYYRNFISSISNLHLVETNLHKKNLVERGINTKMIYVVGVLSFENLKKVKFLKKKKLLNELGIRNNLNKIIISTLHPETTNKLNVNIQNLKILLNVLYKFKNTHNIIITYPNADEGFEKFIEIINKYKNKKNFYIFKNLGYKRYFNVLKMSDFMIGNSSSGIIESGYFNLPVINLGIRQNKRFRGSNVIDCEFDCKKIQQKIKKFIRKKKKFNTPYKFKKNTYEIYKIIMQFIANKK